MGMFAKSPIQKLVKHEMAAVAVTMSRLISCLQLSYTRVDGLLGMRQCLSAGYMSLDSHMQVPPLAASKSVGYQERGGDEYVPATMDALTEMM